MNIPELTVGEIVDVLSSLYINMIRNKSSLKSVYPPFLWGATGIGKSNAIYQLAKRIEDETGKKAIVTDARLLLYTPLDLRGVAIADAKKETTVWLKPDIFKMDDSEDTVNILFLDELSAAPQSMQAAAYQICLERKIGEHSLPENCIVIAAGNRMTDMSVSYKMAKALCNRLMHFNVLTDYEKWRKWAVEKGINDKIIAFLGLYTNRLYIEPGTSDLAFSTPRAWENVSSILNNFSGNVDMAYTLIAATIGSDTALEFKTFCDGNLHKPSIDDILDGKCKEFPRSHSVMYEVVSSLIAKVQEKKENITDSQLENICVYIQKFPKDYITLFVCDMKIIAMRNKTVKNCYAFQELMKKNG